MRRTRVIPCLLMKEGGLVKTRRFRDPVYVGDPINAIKIFNDKEVDELCLLDIDATRSGRGPDLGLIAAVASECFMPLAYGGGIRSLETIRDILKIGVEKVVLNTAAVGDLGLIEQASREFGAQAVVVSIDAKRSLLGGYKIKVEGGRRTAPGTPEAFARAAVATGAGEVLLQSIDRDGTLSGYDIPLIRRIAQSVDVPVIAAGGAGSVDDFRIAVEQGHASAVAAGSMFVFHGKHRAVLINYPLQDALASALS